MSLHLESDVAVNITPELSALMAHVVNDPAREEPATLAEVRDELGAVEPGAPGSLRAQEHASAMEELDRLIAQYGGDQAAADFLEARASEDLARVIEETVADPAWGGEPTLGNVRHALMVGASAALLEEEGYDPSEETAVLVDELETLIERFGPNASAEEFIGR